MNAGSTRKALADDLAAIRAAGEEVDELDTHRNAPRPDPACLYGLIGEIAKAGAETTEANRYAIALNVIAYLSAAVGRGPYMPVGNTWHHCRVFGLHVGRTGVGRKGDSFSLVARLHKALESRHDGIAPQMHRGGLSSREGLAFLVHDGFAEGKNEVPAIDDKRLLVAESEFANVLGQAKRDGNTLSAALRDCWDGVSIRPATKTSRMWATDPHISLACAITPGELRSMLAARELTNGFANRFMAIWAERERVLPFPRATAQHIVDGFADRVAEILKGIDVLTYGKDTIRVDMTPAAQKAYATLYLGELNDYGAGDLVNSLVERRAPTLLRLSMLFAIFDEQREVDVCHLNAALAWVRYWIDSVKYIFASAMDEEAAAEVSSTAEKIVSFVGGRTSATRKEITVECFAGHLSKDKIDAALDELLAATPPRIVVEMVPTNGRAAKVYTLHAANLANKAKNEQRRGLQPDSGVCELGEQGEGSPLREIRAGDIVRKVSLVRELENSPQTRANADCSPCSHSSHGVLAVDASGVEL